MMTPKNQLAAGLLSAAFVFSSHASADSTAKNPITSPVPAADVTVTQPASGDLIQIEAYWVRLNTKQIEDLERSPTDSMPILTDPATLYCRAHTAGFAGQTVAVTTKLTESVIKGAQPIVAPGVLAYDVTTEAQDTGVALEVTPSIAEDQTVHVEVKSEVTDVIRHGTNHAQATRVAAVPATEPAEPLPADQALTQAAKAVIAPIKSEQEFKTAVRLHPGIPMIVGGMTDQPGSSDPRTLCLVLVARVDNAGK